MEQRSSTSSESDMKTEFYRKMKKMVELWIEEAVVDFYAPQKQWIAHPKVLLSPKREQFSSWLISWHQISKGFFFLKGYKVVVVFADSA